MQSYRLTCLQMWYGRWGLLVHTHEQVGVDLQHWVVVLFEAGDPTHRYLQGRAIRLREVASPGSDRQSSIHQSSESMAPTLSSPPAKGFDLVDRIRSADACLQFHYALHPQRSSGLSTTQGGVIAAKKRDETATENSSSST